MSDLISVIVPVYNTERYIDRCIDSITRQTYSKLEIIIVDDGSTDTSPAKCDSWAERDNRIRVIHQANAGQGAARNVALNAATGKYIGFVDSDDYIAPGMYEKLYGLIRANEADMSICEFSHVNEDGEIFATDEKIMSDEVISGEQAIHRLVEKKYSWHYIFIWNKLYRAELFSTLRFPEGVIFEDAHVTYRTAYSARKIAVSSEALYFYTRRHDSTMGRADGKIFYLKSFYDDVYILNDTYNYLISIGKPELTENIIRDMYKLLKRTFRKANYLQYRDEFREFTQLTMNKLIHSRIFANRLRAVKLALIQLRSMLRPYTKEND